MAVRQKSLQMKPSVEIHPKIKILPPAFLLPDKSIKTYSIADEIIGLDSPEPIGEIIINFNTKGIYRMYQKYEKDMKGYILILTHSGDVLYDSSNRYYNMKYPLYGQAEKHYSATAS